MTLEQQLAESVRRLRGGETIQELAHSAKAAPAPTNEASAVAIARAIARDAFGIDAKRADALAREIVQQLEWSGLISH